MSLATMQREPRIATARLVLRPLLARDINDLVAEVNDFEVSRMLARVPYPYSRADARAFLAAAGKDPNDFPLMITAGGKVIGGIGLSQIEAGCEFGYWLGRDHWGKGLASEAGRAFLAYAFDRYAVDSMQSGVFADNPASLRVQEKLGFQPTGRRFVECLARGKRVEHIDTRLTRARFAEISP